MRAASIDLQHHEIEFLNFVMKKAGNLDEIDTATREDIERKIKKSIEDRARGYVLCGSTYIGI